VGRGSLRAQPRRAQVQVEAIVPAGEVGIERAEEEVCPCVVDEHVDVAELGNCEVDESLARLREAQVAREEPRIAARLAYLRKHFVASLLVEAVDDDRRSLTREGVRRRAPDAAGRAGDDDREAHERTGPQASAPILKRRPSARGVPGAGRRQPSR
jgi:hypothetical protein